MISVYSVEKCITYNIMDNQIKIVFAGSSTLSRNQRYTQAVRNIFRCKENRKKNQKTKN